MNKDILSWSLDEAVNTIKICYEKSDEIVTDWDLYLDACDVAHFCAQPEDVEIIFRALERSVPHEVHCSDIF